MAPAPGVRSYASPPESHCKLLSRMSLTKSRGLYEHASSALELHASQIELHKRRNILNDQGFLIHNFLSAAECEALVAASEKVGYRTKSAFSRYFPNCSLESVLAPYATNFLSQGYVSALSSPMICWGSGCWSASCRTFRASIMVFQIESDWRSRRFQFK